MEADEEPASGTGHSARADLSWPLVERRRSAGGPPGGLERRQGAAIVAAGAAIVTATPLAPFRVAALAACVIRALELYEERDWSVIVGTAAIVVFAVVAIARPVPYRDEPRTRLRIVVELAFHTVVVMLTGQWASPLTLVIVPTVMLAGFACGVVYAGQLAAACSIIVSLQYLQSVGSHDGIQDAALWAMLLTLVAVTSGLANRASQESALQQRIVFDQMSRLAEANALLFSLQRVAQTMPASLDMADVLDSTVARVAAMIDHDALTVLLVREGDRDLDVARVLGFEMPPSVPPAQLPEVFRRAVAAPKTVRVDATTDASRGLSPTAQSGLYGSLRARGVLVGLIAVESDQPRAFSAQDAEILHGLTEPFGIAIDNARLFRRLRTIGADEERTRIARDLHDHIGSSLALLGFEVDTALRSAERDEAVLDQLHHLRQQVNLVLREVRETLYDLRTDVTDARDLVGTLRDFLDRVAARSHLDVRFTHDQSDRLPIMQERELWQIAREAITNVERHASAAKLWVRWSCDGDLAELTVGDDGVGLAGSRPRADSYGMLGMRERASGIGADFVAGRGAGSGTVVTVTIDRRRMDTESERRSIWP